MLSLPVIKRIRERVYIMKKFFISLAIVFALAGCAEKKTNPFEYATDVLTKGTADIYNAANDDEIAEIVKRVVLTLDSIDNSDGWREYLELVNNNDTLALKEYESAKEAMSKATNAFADAVASETGK